MTSYYFSCEITPPNVDDETASNKLYEAGCSDALFGVSNGIYTLDFTREATSLDEAILSAIADVKSASIGSGVIRVY
jgi:hypothetical protein